MKKQLEIFNKHKEIRIKNNHSNLKFQKASKVFLKESILPKYSYNFSWLGVPIIQIPQDIYQLQELIWNIKPDLIIETGVAHGGSLIFNASMLSLLNLYKKEKRMVLGVDIDLRTHNKKIINSHFLKKYIKVIEGSSIDKKIFSKVKKISKTYKKILVILDSNHTHDHVLAELNLYSNLVSKNSYCIVFDTIINDMPSSFYNDRSWDKKANPKTAIKAFLKNNSQFKIDKKIDSKLMVSMANNGYLKKK